MEKSALFQELIEEFSFLAKRCVRLIKEYYNLDCHPSRARVLGEIPPKGEFHYENSIKFSFHGEGCSFEIDGQEVDFNFDKEGNFKGFGVYSLRNFARSKGDKYLQFFDKELIDIYLQQFEEKGIIENVNPPYYLYKIKNATRAARLLEDGGK